ncbi:hypothetical protein [Vagococcus salmoninarum]|uniref:hypothetical protein n=1 Tax=Vagococcus salmoninarum TaxID=2739 RepID=UPI0028D5FD27|nr:hypothetical protein [Vagococcus salmoninarum]
MTITHDTTQNKDENYDTYFVESYSGLSSKEYTIVVDYKKKTITGDGIAYGDWFDITLIDCLTILDSISKKGKLNRPYSQLLSSKDESKDDT